MALEITLVVIRRATFQIPFDGAAARPVDVN